MLRTTGLPGLAVPPPGVTLSHGLFPPESSVIEVVNASAPPPWLDTVTDWPRATEVVAYVNERWSRSKLRVGATGAPTVNCTLTVRVGGLASGTLMVMLPV